MNKLTLKEDLFVDVPEVEYQLDTNIELEGPKPGEDVGVSGLLLDLIGKVASDINDLNQLQANLENYPEIAELIKDFADEENVKLGKIQSALKTISPNAEYIMNGAVEAEQEMDPGSPLDEFLIESNNLEPIPETFEIVVLQTFLKQSKKLKLTQSDIEELKLALKTFPPKASIGSGVYKFSWTPSRLNLSKGENRVYYIEVIKDSRAYLVTIYSKKDKDNLTPKETNHIRKLASILNTSKSGVK